MTTRLAILFLITAGISFSTQTQAQTNKYSLSKCASAFYRDSISTPQKKEADLRACIIGKQFPAFSATTITGKKYSNADLKGKVVFVTSWFVTCPACVAEMPLLNELNEKYKDRGFILLSFSADNTDRIHKFLKERPITYEIFPSSEAMIRHEMETLYVYPTNIIVGKNGEIVEFKLGGPTAEKELEIAKNEFMAIIEKELSK